MPLMEKRFQLLLDAGRYELLSAEAQRSGRTVSAVIRDAIDQRFADDEGDARRSAALAEFLAMSEDPRDEQAADWVDIKRELDEEFEAYVDKKAGLG